MEMSPGVRISYMVYYAIVFTIGFLGNALIIITVCKFKKMRNVVNFFLMNLAFADILFVVLSLFDALSFIFDDYHFGEVICRLQSGLIEVSYTVSVLTLSSVAVERYIAICRPYTKKRTKRQCFVMLLLIWLFSLIFCGVLFYGYSIDYEDGKKVCSNTYWSSKYRLIFYIIHSVIVYLIPFIILAICHFKISRALAIQAKRLTFNKPKRGASLDLTPQLSNGSIQNESSFTSSEKELYIKASKKREKVKGRSNVVRLLAIVTLVFFIFWTPFIVVRLIMYSGMEIPTMIWRGSQLLMFGNTAVNVFIYSFMSPSFRNSFKVLFTCGKQSNKWTVVDSSRSLELSEALRNKSEIKR